MDPAAPPTAPLSPAAERRWTLGILAFLLALLWVDLPGTLLTDPDETRYAEISREMLESGDFVTPTQNGAHYFDKPPLLYWVEAGSMALLGTNDFAARLPSRMATLGTAVLVLLALGGPGAAGEGLRAVLLLLSAPLVLALGRANNTDGVLSFALTAAFLCVRGFLLARERGEAARLWLAGVGVSCGLAVLAKGLVGLVLPGLAFLAWTAVTGKWARVREILLSPAPAAFAATAAPWFWLVERANPGFLRRFVLHEHFARFATDAAERWQPPWYFLGVFLVGFAPWVLFLHRAAIPFRSLRPADLRRRPDDLWFALWFLGVLVFYSLSRSKLAPYILPAMPAAAVLAARAAFREEGPGRLPFAAAAVLGTLLAAGGLLYGFPSGAFAGYGVTVPAVGGLLCLPAAGWAALAVLRRRGHVAAVLVLASGAAGLLGAASLAFPAVTRARSLRDVAAAAAGAKGTVVCYRCYRPSIPWYLGRTVPVVGHTGEMGSDGAFPPHLFWAAREFWERWDRGEPLVAVVRRNVLRDFHSRAGTWRVVHDGERYLVLERIR